MTNMIHTTSKTWPRRRRNQQSHKRETWYPRNTLWIILGLLIGLTLSKIFHYHAATVIALQIVSVLHDDIDSPQVFYGNTKTVPSEISKITSYMRVDNELLRMNPAMKEEWEEIKKHATRINVAEMSFCLAWTVASDQWWTHNPEWEISEETDLFYCFRYKPIAISIEKFSPSEDSPDTFTTKNITDLYNNQFHGDCSSSFPWRMWSSGYGADIQGLKYALREAFLSDRPLQITQYPWHYAAPDAAGKGNKGLPSSEACPTRNLNCYFLNISNCPSLPKGVQEMFQVWPPDGTEEEQFFLRRFTVRPQLWLRKKVYSFVQEQIQKNGFRADKPCTAIHVRRGDILMHSGENRTYHPISDYLNASVIDPSFQLKDNVFLLTDDDNAINEAKALFPHIHWMSIDRPRFKAEEGGWEHQIPSNDPVFEMVVLQSIFQLVQRCDSLVRTNSNFGELLEYNMKLGNATAQVFNLDDEEYEGHFVHYTSENNTKTKKFSRHFSQETKLSGNSSVAHTTCQKQRGLPNTKFLHIDPSKPGGFPETQFTHYIQTGIINRLNKRPAKGLCGDGVLEIRHPKSSNSTNEFTDVGVELLLGGKSRYSKYFSVLLRRVFSKDCERQLPPSHDDKPTFLGFLHGDWLGPRVHTWRCFTTGSTSQGIFSVHNFEYMAYYVGFPEKRVTNYPLLPWEERDPIPVFRGQAWETYEYLEKVEPKENQSLSEIFDEMIDGIIATGSRHQRLPLAKFSIDHPNLLNARSRVGYLQRLRIKSLFNITEEELDKNMLPYDSIPSKDYYTKYQVTVVMGGIGSAFRLSDHLAMGSAVILQDIEFQEWFTPYMTPYVNYIPLKQNLSDLHDVLQWVQDNPRKVQEIATHGRLFYEQYLSYEMLEEFFYELTYRLAEARIYNGTSLNIPPSLLERPYTEFDENDFGKVHNFMMK